MAGINKGTEALLNLLPDKTRSRYLYELTVPKRESRRLGVKYDDPLLEGAEVGMRSLIGKPHICITYRSCQAWG